MRARQARHALSARVRAAVVVLTVLTTGMAQRPTPHDQAWDIFVLPEVGAVEFLIVSGRERRRPHEYAQLDEPGHRADSIEALETRLASIPHGDWLVFQYLDERLAAGDGRALRTRLQHACRALRQRCAFAM
jgi:hypothetical protein